MTLITALALTGPLRPRYFAPPLRRRTPAGSGPSGSGGLALRPSGPGPWRRPPSEPVIGSSDVHVWRVPIADAGPSDLALLDERERERADRFRFGAHRQQYVAAHAALRRILGGYVGADPRDVAFTQRACRSCGGPHGKPVLEDRHGSVSFSLSHADDLALVAVARGREVGVDIERVRVDLACERLASRVFTSDERALLEAMPPEYRPGMFFALWTRLEARVKATGAGLAMMFAEGREPAGDDATDAVTGAPISVVDLAMGAEHRGAIAWTEHVFPSDAVTVECWLTGSAGDPRATERNEQ